MDGPQALSNPTKDWYAAQSAALAAMAGSETLEGEKVSRTITFSIGTHVGTPVRKQTMKRDLESGLNAGDAIARHGVM